MNSEDLKEPPFTDKVWDQRLTATYSLVYAFVGDKCDEFFDECTTCKAWAFYDELVTTLECVRDDEDHDNTR